MATTYKQRKYTESEPVKQFREQMNAQAGMKPADYVSQYKPQIDSTVNSILNRKDFKYDVNGDALYQQYKDRYVNLGQQAMMDTMGQAAKLTGGYGNSNAQMVGQQAYQGYLQGLTDKIPELYQMAYDQYNKKGQDLYQQYGLLSEQDQAAYDRWNADYSRWLKERDYLTGRYDTERDYDYSKWSNDRTFDYGQYVDDRNYNRDVLVSDRNYEYNKAVDDRNYNRDVLVSDRNYDYTKAIDERNFGYQQDRDKVSDDQWKALFDQDAQQWKSQYDEGVRQWQAQFDEDLRRFNFQNKLGEFAPVVSGGGGHYSDNSTEGNSAYNELRNKLNSGKYSAADMIKGIATAEYLEDISASQANALKNEFYKPQVSEEVKNNSSGNDTSAYWSKYKKK